MSRIGRKPVPLPKGVTAQIDGQRITVKGPKGEIGRTIHAELAMALEDAAIVVRRPSDETRHKALHGLTRTLIANMVDGVTKGSRRRSRSRGWATRPNPSRSACSSSSVSPIRAVPRAARDQDLGGEQRRRQGRRRGQGARGAGGRGDSRDPSTRAVQGQGGPLRGRAGPAQAPARRSGGQINHATDP